MSGLVIFTVRRGLCIEVGTTGMMGTDMIEEMMEKTLIRAAKMTSGHWMLCTEIVAQSSDAARLHLPLLLLRRIYSLPMG